MGVDAMRLWYCSECGAVYFRDDIPARCEACYAHSEEFFDTVEIGAEPVPDAEEECPNCGEFVPVGEVTHELGGSWCPECS